MESVEEVKQNSTLRFPEGGHCENDNAFHRELVDRAKRGSYEAKCQLLDELQDMWFRFALLTLDERDMAKEAVQETALRCLLNLKAYRGKSTVKTWTLGIVLNICREMIRKKINGDPNQRWKQKGSISEPIDELEKKEMIEGLRELLNDLPSRQRQAVILRYFEDLSVAESATIMECAEGTIKATLFQAIKHLKNCLGARND